MKVRMYMDFYGGALQTQFNATSNPSVKGYGVRRMAFDLHIPDDMLYQVDRMAVEVGKVELVEDHTDENSK